MQALNLLIMLRKLKLKNLFRRVGNGVLDSLPIVSTIKANVENDHSADKNGNGFGKLDWVRIIVNVGSVAIALYITYNVVKGNLTISQAKELINIVK